MLFEVPPPQYYSVAALTQLVNQLVKGVGKVFVEGEVSSFSSSRSRHWYFDIKDDAQPVSLSCCMFYNKHRDLDWKPVVGNKLQLEGHLNVYQGKVSFIITEMTLVGEGNHELRLQELRKKLQQEGLFDLTKKRPLPKYPKTVGIATSITSEALKDILMRLQDRMAGLTVYLADCSTEGEKAASSIVSALQLLQEHGKSEVLIVGRGGGSKDSLRAFDQEDLVRAIASSSIPIVCAVGHEGDTCLSDLVADVRAATPTHAAETVTAETKAKILLQLQQRKILLSRRMRQKIENRREVLRQIRPSDPRSHLTQKQMHLASLQTRLHERLKWLMGQRNNQILQKKGQLDALNPAEVLERGYSVTLKNGKSVVDAKTLRQGDQLVVQLASGKAIVRVQDIILEGEQEQLQLKLGD